VGTGNIFTSHSTGGALLGVSLFAYATFGRDIARFHQLIEFLTWLSITLWCFVIITTVLRAGAAVAHTRSLRYNKTSLQGRMPSRSREHS
jgi:hypothetical protein